MKYAFRFIVGLMALRCLGGRLPVIGDRLNELFGLVAPVMEGTGSLTGRWITPYGFYLPVDGGYDFIMWRHLLLYGALLLLTVILWKYEREMRALRNERDAAPGRERAHGTAHALSRKAAPRKKRRVPGRGGACERDMRTAAAMDEPVAGDVASTDDLNDAGNLELVRHALDQGLPLKFSYTDRDNNTTGRCVDPHRLYCENGRWYLEGWCRLRGDTRNFRVDRMERLRPPAADAEGEFEQEMLM